MGWTGSSFSLGLQISTSHIQIVYYTTLLAGSYVIYKLIIDLKNKEVKQYWISTLVCNHCRGSIVLPNNQNGYGQAYEIFQIQIRGGQSELKDKIKNTKGNQRG